MFNRLKDRNFLEYTVMGMAFIAVIFMFVGMLSSCQPRHVPGVYPGYAPTAAPQVQTYSSPVVVESGGGGFGSSMAGGLIGGAAGAMIGNHLSKDRSKPAVNPVAPVAPAQRFSAPRATVSPQPQTVTTTRMSGGGTRYSAGSMRRR